MLSSTATLPILKTGLCLDLLTIYGYKVLKVFPMDNETDKLSGIRRAIADAGIDDEAGDWLTKALHPPSHMRDVAIPDDTFRPSIRLDLRPSVTISNPAGEASPWDLCVITTPGDAVGARWCIGPAGTDFRTVSSGDVGVTIGFLPLQSSGPDRSFQGYSVPYSGGATTLTPFRAQSLSSAPWAFRTTYRSSTIEMVSSTLVNGGNVTAAQFDNDWEHEPGFTVMARPGGPTTAVGSATTLPLSEGDITLQAPSSFVGMAKDGVYIPHRLMGPQQSFVTTHNRDSSDFYPDGSSFRYFIAAPVSGTIRLPSQPRIIADASSDYPTVVRWIDDLTTLCDVDDTNYDRCTSSVTIFRGLDPTSSLNLRMYVGLELVPTAQSPMRVFVRPPLPPDQKAMLLYYHLASSMRTVYPASYNQFSLLLPILTKAIRSLGTYIAPYAIRFAKAGVERGARDIEHLIEGGSKKAKPKPAQVKRGRLPKS